MYFNPVTLVTRYLSCIVTLNVPYNRNIWRREILANRLNFSIGKNLNWQNGMVGSRDFMDATLDTHEQAREVRQALGLRLKNLTFLMMHSF